MSVKLLKNFYSRGDLVHEAGFIYSGFPYLDSLTARGHAEEVEAKVVPHFVHPTGENVTLPTHGPHASALTVPVPVAAPAPTPAAKKQAE